MSRLINAYRKLPSPSNRVKLQTFLDTHPLAIAVARDEDLVFLNVNGFRY